MNYRRIRVVRPIAGFQPGDTLFMPIQGDAPFTLVRQIEWDQESVAAAMRRGCLQDYPEERRDGRGERSDAPPRRATDPR
jgi:hypothetical protein